MSKDGIRGRKMKKTAIEIKTCPNRFCKAKQDHMGIPKCNHCALCGISINLGEPHCCGGQGAKK